MKQTLGVKPCDILIPAPGTDLYAYSVVACDQFTSDAAYWQKVEHIVGEKPSTLRMTFPEIYLKKDNRKRTEEINQAMSRYLASNLFREFPDAVFYVERTLSFGGVRRGIVLAADLEEYEYSPDSHSLIRATEGTIEDRLPPRVLIRKDAPIELPHIMLLIDDKKHELIAPLAEMEKMPVYQTELMLGGGSIKGWCLGEEAKAHVLRSLPLADCGTGENIIRFAVGDGNHSLATAKKCWEELKKTLTPQQQKDHPARYALCEIVNLHEESMLFEPIHRVLFQVDTADFLKALKGIEGNSGQTCMVLTDSSEQAVCLNPSHTLTVGTMQRFLDEYIQAHPGVRIDYVHEAEQVKKLAKEANTVGILLPAIQKETLFPAVQENGPLPRKTFSMGMGQDKRYYLEARKIR